MCIFARSLRDVLHAKDKRIGSLYTVLVDERPIPPVQIIRLQRAAGGDCTLSVTLNPAQLEAVRDKFKLDTEDMRQLKTALLAESQFRLLLDRIPSDNAVRIAEGIFRLLLDADADTLNAYGLDFDTVRGDPDEYVLEDLPPTLSALEHQVHAALEPVAQAYEEGELWLDCARTANHPGRVRAYAELATSLLAHAARLLASTTVPGELSALPEQWRRLIEQAQVEAVHLTRVEA